MSLENQAIDYFKKSLAEALKIDAKKIKADAPMEVYGIDSVMVVELTQWLEKSFGRLSKTLFFEYQTIGALSRYFIDNFTEQLLALINRQQSEHATQSSSTLTEKRAIAKLHKNTLDQPIANHLNSANQSGDLPINKAQLRQSLGAGSSHSKAVTGNNRPLAKSTGPIAIIGLSGRFPKARNISEFWQNLVDGRDCISEIPNERWDHSRYFHPKPNQLGKSYSKWGGFIDGVEEFDAQFFNILPREAEILDPQERLFLQCVQETLEDAGYTRDNLLTKEIQKIRHVGVYVGVMYQEYQLIGAQAQLSTQPFALGGSAASIANRISYYFNFHGPSLAIDTMCSSSLTAIHLACESIQNNTCEVAFAGGVNVSIHPNKYLLLSQGGFASSNGRCESFGNSGDGYVPGEGVGAVLLKPVKKAMDDGDHIYGLVLASTVNHGGKTNGYTVPNPVAQGELIATAIANAHIDASSISYIEAHGTGTPLGDPIEISGLSEAFRRTTSNPLNQAKPICAIGSVKSNIGHCESAAGIAGVAKVLLQFKHQLLVPSLHSNPLNENIDFAQTPFIVQQELAQWQRPSINVNGQLIDYPLRAGVSSFGAGGANAHVILEEFNDLAVTTNNSTTRLPNAAHDLTHHPAFIVLSAATQQQLVAAARQLHAAIIRDDFKAADLPRIAYTLQTGREAKAERLALVAKDLTELQQQLTAFIEQSDLKSGEKLGEKSRDTQNIYTGRIQEDSDLLTVFDSADEIQQAITQWLDSKHYQKLLKLWLKGVWNDWPTLYTGHTPKRISLPTYPFARDRYWVDTSQLIAPIVTASQTQLAAQPPAPTQVTAQAAFDDTAQDLVLLTPTWQSVDQDLTSDLSATALSQTVAQKAASQAAEHRILFIGAAKHFAQLTAQLPNITCQRLDIDETLSLAESYTRYATQLLLALKEILDSRPSQSVLLQLVVTDTLLDAQEALSEQPSIDKNNTDLSFADPLFDDSLSDDSLFEHSLSAHSGGLGLAAMLKSATLENPKLITQSITVSLGNEFSQQVKKIATWLTERAVLSNESDWLYRTNGYYVQRLQRVTAELLTKQFDGSSASFKATLPICWKSSATYLITGGLGGIGFTVASRIADDCMQAGLSGVKLILTGRRPLETHSNSTQQQQLAALNGNQVKAFYYTVDVADGEQVNRLVAECNQSHGRN